MNRKMLVAFAATAAFALPTAAFALDKNIDVIVDGRTATGDESLSVGIKLGDLDLASDQGQRTASARIDHAARTICTWKTGTVIPEREDYRACYSDAIDSARQDLQSFAQAQRQG